jgi:hypothetical protein
MVKFSLCLIKQRKMKSRAVWRYNSTHSKPQYYTEMSGKLQASANLPPVLNRQEAGWGQVGLDILVKTEIHLSLSGIEPKNSNSEPVTIIIQLLCY